MKRPIALVLAALVQLGASAALFDKSLFASASEPGFRVQVQDAQLKTVAQLIASRGALGSKRQVFLVSLGGFDLHDAARPFDRQ